MTNLNGPYADVPLHPSFNPPPRIKPWKVVALALGGVAAFAVIGYGVNNTVNEYAQDAADSQPFVANLTPRQALIADMEDIGIRFKSGDGFTHAMTVCDTLELGYSLGEAADFTWTGSRDRNGSAGISREQARQFVETAAEHLCPQYAN